MNPAQPEDFLPGDHDQDADDGGSISWNQVQHFLYAPLRRPLTVILPWLGVILLSVAVLFVLPKKYRSSTLILIESEKVPDSFVARVATQDATGRLENIKPEILSRTRLERVLEETKPYPDVESRTRAVELLRAAIAINQSGQDGFTLEFVHRNPEKAQQVTERLATLFMDESVKAREQQVQGAVDFLVTQVKEARRQLEEKDAALRQFKEQRMGRLPEQLQANLATLEMLQKERQMVEESLYLAREKMDALALGARRPAGETRRAGDSSAEPSDLQKMRNDLDALRERYTDEHPDVRSLRARVARAEKRAADAASAGVPADPSESSAALTRQQLGRVREDVEKLQKRQADLESRISSTRARVEETPRTEQELANLTRDYQKLSENYSQLLTKQLDAEMAGRLEQRWKGARFRMLDPANLPEKPDSPKPKLILALGGVFGLLIGIGVSVAAEVLDPTVKDAEQLQNLLPCPVLGRIPHLAPADTTRAR